MIAPHEQSLSGPAADFGATLRAALPVLETKRLRLRAPRIEDFEAYAQIATSPRGSFILDEPTREAAWFDFAHMTATWLLRGHGLWAVEMKASEDLLGFVLLGFEPGDHEPELGYMFLPAAEGQGFAAEAAAAAKAHGLAVLPSLVSTIDYDNVRSIALAERLGGVRDRAAEAAHDHAIQVYRYAKGDLQ